MEGIRRAWFLRLLLLIDHDGAKERFICGFGEIESVQKFESGS